MSLFLAILTSQGTSITTIVFDTHAIVKELAEAGMPEKQAEVLARSQATLINETLATKQDLNELETRLRRDMNELETRLRRDMKEMELRLKHDLTMRLGSMMVVAIGAVAALVKLL
jgi:DNA anti-recombination protein RmuC